ncbi:MAG TPA: MFS transporter [Terracidiphilus sp.]|jgi:PAT family beta-lactamase induction signal transducer AmpG
MSENRRIPPIWLMGLGNATMGFSTGLVYFVLPQLLAADHVPEGRIATMTAIAFSTNFWCILFAPMLDVRFSRRWYATALAASGGLSVTMALFTLQHYLLLEVAMVVNTLSVTLSSSALGGWLSGVVAAEDKNFLSKWMNIALVSGTGIASVLGGELARLLPISLAALVLGLLVFLPASIFLLIPAPGPDRRLAAESFEQFNREVLLLFRRREVVVVLLLFLVPCSTFALPNLLGGLGADFHASERLISLSGGIGAFFPGILGCTIFPFIAKRIPLRFFYLANGILGSLFTLSLVVLPHAPLSFGLALLGEFLFQAVAFSIQIGIVFEAIGPNNPLAATTFSFLTAATNVSVTYVMLIDGHAYTAGGIRGILAVDAAIGVGTCIIAGLLLAKFDRRANATPPLDLELAEIANLQD